VNPAANDFSRLILFRPRREFPLPDGWAGRESIPLGELRPLLQAISPVRDLSDLWRWAAIPLPRGEVEDVLAHFPWVVEREAEFHRGGAEHAEANDREAAVVQARLVPAEATGAVERIELSPAGGGLLGLTSPAARAAMLTVATALRQACDCLAVGL
jgi:hypothetical protein